MGFNKGSRGLHVLKRVQSVANVEFCEEEQAGKVYFSLACSECS